MKNYLSSLVERKVSIQWKKAIIVPLSKNKGSKLDCGNFRGISLISVPSKLLMRTETAGRTGRFPGGKIDDGPDICSKTGHRKDMGVWPANLLGVHGSREGV